MILPERIVCPSYDPINFIEMPQDSLHEENMLDASFFLQASQVGCKMHGTVVLYTQQTGFHFIFLFFLY